MVGRLRDLASSQPTQPILKIRGARLWLTDAAFSLDGRTLIVGGRVDDGAIAAIAYDTVDKREKWRIPSNDEGSNAHIRMDGDGELVS